MKLQVFSTYDELSKFTSDCIVRIVKGKPSALICIAGGDTPLQTIRYLVESIQSKEADFSQVTFVGLDEWVGLGVEDEGGCLNFLQRELFTPANIQKEQIFFFDAKSSDLQSECNRMDRIIFEKGPIDFMLLGVGMNGHLGFNEPGVDFNLHAHVIDLDDVTKTVGQKYFVQQTVLSKGITLGGNHILSAKEVVLMANGTKKAEIIKKTLNSKVATNSIPSTLLQEHTNAFVWVDQDAANLL